MNREWMYRRSTSKGDFSPQFLNGLESFIEFACSKPAFMDGENIRCPCRKCQNRYFRDVETVRAHVKKKGFEFNYQVWVFQGESRVSDQFQHTVVGDRGDHVSTRHRNVSRNYEGQVDEQNDDPDMPSIFKHIERPFGRVSHRYLTDKEYNAIRIYALTNCVEVDQYIDVFVDELRSSHSSLTFTDANNKINKEFAEWFAAYARTPTNNVNKIMRDFAKGPSRMVRVFPACFVNGYKFHTTAYGSHKATIYSGVCVKGAQYGADESDYYGRLLEVVEVEYPGLPIKKMLIFKCEWFDDSSAGTQVHHAYKLVSLNHGRKYAGDDAFVLASQAIQVFYCSNPSLNRSKSDWWTVCKTQARANVQVPASNESTSSNIPPPLQEDDLAQSGGSVGENLYATFRRYHFKNGVWSDAKSQRIGDEVERRLEEARQPLQDGTLPPSVDPNEIYLEVIGGSSSKNRIFGIGSLYSGSQSATSPARYLASQPFTVGPTPEQIHDQIQRQVQEQVQEQLQQRVQEQVETQLAAQRAIYETLLKESQEKFREDMQSQMATMMDFFSRSTRPPPGSGSRS